MDRRRFINVFFGGSFMATLAAFLYPVIRYVLPPKQAEAVQKKVAAAKVGDLAPNTAKIFKFGSTPAILINSPDGKLLAFSAICTHLTCTVTYETSTGTLFCPCHNGRFDMAGNVVSGPPPRPIETYAVEIVGEDIFVSRDEPSARHSPVAFNHGRVRRKGPPGKPGAPAAVEEDVR